MRLRLAYRRRYVCHLCSAASAAWVSGSYGEMTALRLLVIHAAELHEFEPLWRTLRMQSEVVSWLMDDDDRNVDAKRQCWSEVPFDVRQRWNWLEVRIDAGNRIDASSERARTLLGASP